MIAGSVTPAIRAKSGIAAAAIRPRDGRDRAAAVSVTRVPAGGQHHEQDRR